MEKDCINCFDLSMCLNDSEYPCYHDNDDLILKSLMTEPDIYEPQIDWFGEN